MSDIKEDKTNREKHDIFFLWMTQVSQKSVGLIGSQGQYHENCVLHGKLIIGRGGSG